MEEVATERSVGFFWSRALWFGHHQYCLSAL